MGNLRFVSKLYIVMLALFALGLTVFTLARAGLPDPERTMLTVTLAVLTTLAYLFPLHFARKTKVTLATSTTLAAVLLLEPGIAMLVIGASRLTASVIRRRESSEIVFNFSQATLQAGVGGLILAAAGWNTEAAGWDHPVRVLAILVAAVVMYLINTFSVVTIIGLQSHQSPLAIWRSSTRFAAVEYLSQLALGLVGAAVAGAHVWALPLLSLPAFAVYRSLEHQAELRRRTEEELQRTEAGLAETQRIARLGNWEWDLAANGEKWSSEAYRIYGYEPGAIEPSYGVVLDAVHPDDRERVKQAVHAAMYEGDTYDIKYRIVLPDGRQRTVRSKASVLFDRTGKPTRMAGAVQDVTEQEKVAAKLRETEVKFRTLVEQIPAVTYIDTTDRISSAVYMSPQVEAMLGYAPQEWLDDPELRVRLIHAEDKERVLAEDRRTDETGDPFKMEYRMIARDGRVVWVRDEAVVLKDEAGKQLYWQGVLFDITEQKLAEAQREELLAQVEAALEFRNRFLSITSHELKTPITILKGYTELLNERVQDRGASNLEKPLRVINRQADLMTHLIDDLLDISRIESGKVAFDLQPFDLNAAVGEVMGEVALGAQGFEFSLREDAKGLCVRGDRLRIQQVITNLLTNAVKYSRDRKEVDVVVGRIGDKAWLEVTDHGIGIPEAHQASVFELYFRAANAPANNSGGLGLGLFISRTIIERHGGEISLVSEEGKGSTFRISLPIQQEAQRMELLPVECEAAAAEALR